ncbi:MAPK regulated corepressor interacting protein 2-like isoform X2 [Takifugu flavidus]|uniref:MAPK regulated corepressor interacting protein 2-like isoform X2 n=1 Tax=Takifugu flavidus TaxID=433684 RepID=UPI0025444CF0|nr:MAPK regulated corepressor interacting protein 2-like isoform X2 [Takifugu flavidus]
MMYTITRGPSKLVTQRRTAPTQQLDTKINDLKHKPSPCTDLPAPRIVFSIRKHPRPAPTRPADRQQIESFTPAHEQNVRFVHDGGNKDTRTPPFPQHTQACTHTLIPLHG